MMLWAVLVLVQALVVPAEERVSFDIRDYGARSDGHPGENARAIQAAIDVATKQGGRVVVPAGTWITGTLWLKSGVELHLAKDAVLKASTGMEDYNALDAYPENWSSKGEGWVGKHMLIAREVANVSITGPGAVDGSGDAFFAEKAEVDRDRDTWIKGFRKSRDVEKGRPGQLVVFVKCRDVFVGSGLLVTNSPCWSVFCYGCENVTVRDYLVRNGLVDANTDGLDIDCCRNVRIERADIVTGDDGIAIRASGRRLGGGVSKRTCENIVVRDCTLQSEAMGIRLGVGDGVIRNVRVENVQIPHSSRAIAFFTWYGWTEEHLASQGVDMEDIVFEKVVTGDCFVDVKLVAGGRKQAFGVRNVSFVECTFGGGVNIQRQVADGAVVEDFNVVNCHRRPVTENSYRRFYELFP